MKTLIIQPAYGRDYPTAKKAMFDWAAGRDFKIVNGPYLSKRDTQALIDDGYTHIELRYQCLFECYMFELELDEE